MCRVLDVSVSGYYNWTQRSESNRSIETRKVKEAIKRIHKENREIIGHSFSKRMTAETTVNPALDMALMRRKPPQIGRAHV